MGSGFFKKWKIRFPQRPTARVPSQCLFQPIRCHARAAVLIQNWIEVGAQHLKKEGLVLPLLCKMPEDHQLVRIVRRICMILAKQDKI